MKHINQDVVIVDLRAFEYLIVEQCRSLGLTSPVPIQTHATKAFIHLLSGCWLHAIHPREFRFLFVCDTKPYWRHMELEKIGCNYKANRNKDAKRQEVLGHIHTQLLHLFHKNNIPLLQHSFYNAEGMCLGFEADDLAASFIKKHGHECNKIYTLTIDTDWLPFTSKPNVTWLGLTCTEKLRQDGTRNYSPRIRTEKEAIKWWQLHTASNSSKVKRAFVKENIYDLWEFKAEFGDTSDNIPGNVKDKTPGKYNQFINLWGVPSEYDATTRVLFPAFITKPYQPMPIEQYRIVANIETFSPFERYNQFPCSA